MNDELAPEDSALLDWVNGKNITPNQFVLIIKAGYVNLSDKALRKLAELEGAVHDLNPAK